MPTSAERLRTERERLGFSQADFAELGGAKKHSQINYEKGRTAPSGDYLSAISEAGVDVLYVLTGRNEKTHADRSIPNSTLIKAIELVEQGLRDRSARLAPDKYAGLVVAVADYLESDLQENAAEAVGNIIKFAS